MIIRTEYLLNKELEHVLAALTYQNQLVCRVCIHTGLRLSDVLALKPQQLKPRFWITEKKTKKRRMVGLKSDLLWELKCNCGKYWVFPSKTDATKHRTRQAVWKDVKRAAKAFRLPQNVAPHSFRKVYAVELLKKYGDIEKVRRALNHSDEATTLIYALADAQLTAKKYRNAAKRGKIL